MKNENAVIIINRGNIVADDLLSNLQKANAGQQKVNVEFKETINVEDLKSLIDVIAVSQLSTFNFQLSTNNPESVRKQLLELSLKNNLNIVSLQNETSTLEDVFRNLTQNQNQDL